MATPNLDARAKDGISPRDRVQALATVDPNVRSAQLGLTASAERAKAAEIKETDKAQAIEDKGKTNFFGELGSTRSVLTGLAALGALVGGEDEAALGIAIGGVVGTGQRVDTINQNRQDQQEKALSNASRDRAQDIEARKALVNTAVELEGNQFAAAVAVLQQDMSHEQKLEHAALQNRYSNEAMDKTQNYKIQYQALVRVDDREDVATARLLQLEVMELTEAMQDRGAGRDNEYTEGLMGLADKYRKLGVKIDQDFAEKMSAISAGYDRDAASALFQSKLDLIDKYSDERKIQLEEKYGKDYAVILAAGTMSLDGDEAVRQDLESQKVAAVLVAMRENRLASLPESVRSSVVGQMTDKEALDLDNKNTGNEVFKGMVVQSLSLALQNNDAKAAKAALIMFGFSEDNTDMLNAVDDAIVLAKEGRRLDAIKRLEPFVLAGATVTSLNYYNAQLSRGIDPAVAVLELNWRKNPREVEMEVEIASQNAVGRLLNLWSKETDPEALENPAVWLTQHATSDEGRALLATGMYDQLIPYLGTNAHNSAREKVLFQYGQMTTNDTKFAEREDELVKMNEASMAVFALEQNSRRVIIAQEFIPEITGLAQELGLDVFEITGNTSDARDVTDLMESLLTTMSSTDLRSPEALRSRAQDLREGITEAIEKRSARDFKLAIEAVHPTGVTGAGMLELIGAFAQRVFGSDPFDEAVKELEKGK